MNEVNWKIDAILTSDNSVVDVPEGLEIPVWGMRSSVDVTLTPSQLLLKASDWEVLRELEKLFLADTALHAEREILRAHVDIDLHGEEGE